MADTGSDGGLRNTLYRRAHSLGPPHDGGPTASLCDGVPVGLAIIRLWWASCRIVRVEGVENLQAALDKAPSFVPCFWHQHQGFCAKYLLDERARGFAVGWLISPSVDGEIGVMLVRRVGGKRDPGLLIPYGRARAARLLSCARAGEHFPGDHTGWSARPALQVKTRRDTFWRRCPGGPWLPMAYAASRALLIKWDKFVLPWPGSRIVIAIGPPRYVPRVVDAAHIKRLQREMEAELLRLYRWLETLLKTSSTGR